MLIADNKINDIEYLLNLEGKDSLGELFKRAREIKEARFGKRITLFAPLYLSNECINNCLYCGFRIDNRQLKRETLNEDEILKQAGLLANLGYKKILLVCAENERLYDAAAISRTATLIYSATNIKDIGVNIAPQDAEGFEALKESRISLYQSFQETYHEGAYRAAHPSAKKADFRWRLDTMDRAARAGIRNLGLGVLLGLYDWRPEILSLIEHAKRLSSAFDADISISVPRLRPALGAPLKSPPYPVSELDLKKIIAILRVALPESVITVSTRESAGFRNEAIFLGASQLSAASRTSPGGYEKENLEYDKSQFSIEDTRSLKEIKEYISSAGLEPA